MTLVCFFSIDIIRKLQKLFFLRENEEHPYFHTLYSLTSRAKTNVLQVFEPFTGPTFITITCNETINYQIRYFIPPCSADFLTISLKDLT